MQKTGSRLRAVTALAATVLLGTGALTGCSSDDKSPTAGTTAQAGTSTQAAADHAGMGAAVKGKGATVTVTGAFETDTIELNPEGRKPGTSPTEPTSARQGGKYVVIQTKVVNDSPRDMDMTCGFGVQAELQTDQSASYKPIDSLYRIPGNPDCNDNLGSGFDTDMTWVFLVPKDRKPLTFGFADPETAYNDLTYVTLDKFGQKSPATGKQPSPTTGTPAGASGDTGTSSDAITGDTGGDPNPTADPGTGPASAPDSVASNNVSPAADPVIGFTGAPSVDSPHVLDKEIAGCGDPALHQTGTTFFTDGTSGWTESCAAQMG